MERLERLATTIDPGSPELEFPGVRDAFRHEERLVHRISVRLDAERGQEDREEHLIVGQPLKSAQAQLAQ